MVAGKLCDHVEEHEFLKAAEKMYMGKGIEF